MLFPCSVECRTLVCERNLFVLYERAFVALHCRPFEWKGGGMRLLCSFAFTIQNYVLHNAERNFMMGYEKVLSPLRQLFISLFQTFPR